MALYKRPDSNHWHIRFRCAGAVVRTTSGTDNRKHALLLQDKLRADAWHKAKLPEQVQRTVGELVHQWESVNRARALTRERQILAQFLANYGASAPLSGVNDFATYANKLAHTMGSAGINRHLAVLKMLSKFAHRQGWITEPWRIETIKTEPVQPRWITREQAPLLLGALPDHARTIATFALETGLRFGNIVGMEWSWLDLGAGTASVPALRAKARKPITIPLSETALRLIEAQRGKHNRFVFTNHRGEAPVTNIAKSWKRATIVANQKGLRIHDLRHSWASHHVLQGTPTIALKALGGWSDTRMVDRYSHLSVSDLRRYVK